MVGVKLEWKREEEGWKWGQSDIMEKICVRICVRKTLQYLLNLAKIRKNYKKQNQVISNTSFNLRRLGSSEVLTTNPQVGCSNHPGRAMYHAGYMAALNST